MREIRVLIVDDSAVARDFITELLTTDEKIVVVGQAANGKEGVSMALALMPDIVLMDIEMPVMNGLEAIGNIMSTEAIPILVITSQGDATTAYKAVSYGALEVMPKSDLDALDPEKLTKHVRLLSKVKVITHIRNKVTPSAARVASLAAPEKAERVIAIASSTGGPKALSEILPHLPADYPFAVLVAQHIADGFVESLASWLNDISALKVKVAENKERIEPGTVYFSPSDSDLSITAGKRVELKKTGSSSIYHPSCDVLLCSVAAHYGAKAIGVVLTGMGYDGVKGLGDISEAGGTTIAQDEASCIVYGMPKIAVESGCVGKVLPLNSIGAEFNILGATATTKVRSGGERS
jgi:two-component system chemotaxis response regulator CheB